jgi:hypothetical protein
VSEPESDRDGRTLTVEMDVVETQILMPTVLRRDYDKRLMLVTGRANPELAGKIADKLGVELCTPARSRASSRSRAIT